MIKWAATIFACGTLVLSAASATAGDVPPETVNFEDGSVSMSLTGTAGDAEAGAAIFANRKQGNCLACHAVSELSSQAFHGNVGPEMDGVADRWEEAELRAIVADSKKVFGEETVMPGFYSLEVGENVRKDLIGTTILTAQQVEDVVAFLTTLKE